MFFWDRAVKIEISYFLRRQIFTYIVGYIWLLVISPGCLLRKLSGTKICSVIIDITHDPKISLTVSEISANLCFLKFSKILEMLKMFMLWSLTIHVIPNFCPFYSISNRVWDKCKFRFFKIFQNLILFSVAAILNYREK